MKPRLRLSVIAGRPVTVPIPQSAHEMKLEQARQRHGKPFCFERGQSFEWRPEPTVLTPQWLASQQKRRTG